MSHQRTTYVTRRKFLETAALAGSAAAIGSLAGWPFPRRTAWAAPYGMDLRTPTQPIDHVVVLMMENRSFDHYFGWKTGTHLQGLVPHYPNADPGSSDPREAWQGQVQAAYDDENPFPTFHLAPDYRGCNPGAANTGLAPYVDPDHSWDGGRRQMQHGFLTGRNDAFAAGYYLESDVEFYAKLARQFTLCDNYHCSVLAPTFPNREYMHSAWSGGMTTNALPPDVPGMETGFTWDTIWDLLDEAGIPWGSYFVDLPAIGLWGSRLLHGGHHIEEFFADARSGKLPNVVFVDPGFTTGFRTDEHPYSDIRSGQAFSHNVVKAIVESPLWHRTVMFLNYDEWGGFFDHVAPTTVADETQPLDGSMSPRTGEDFGLTGFRVPSFVISPYAMKGKLASEILDERSLPAASYDHVSILRYIKDRFGLPSLTARHKRRFPDRFAAATSSDRHADAPNIGDLLAGEPADRLDAAEIVEALPRPLVHSCPCHEEFLEGTFVGGDVERPATEAADDAFAQLGGFLDSIGAPIGSPKLHDILCAAL